MAILITGGSGKIGKQLVKAFVKNQAVVVPTRKISKIEKEFEYNKNLYFVEVNLEEENSSDRVYEFIQKHKINIDILINCARNLEYVKHKDKPTSRQNWIGEYTLGVIVPYELSVKFRESLKKIINISSMYGVVPQNPNLYQNYEKESCMNYGVVKAGLIHLTKELSIYLKDSGITVNAVSFGGIEGRVDENFKQRYAQLCPMGRMLKEEEVTGAVEFLISDKSAGITGHNLVVDGGWTTW